MASVERGGGERTYEYKPTWWVIFAFVVFFGACSATGARLACSHRGLILDGIPLSPEWAAAFWWIISALGFGLVLYAVRAAVHRMIQRQRIVLAPTAIILPESRWSFDEISVPYSEITAIWETSSRRQRFLKIAHRGGVSTIIATFLPAFADFADVRSLLIQRVEASKIDE